MIIEKILKQLTPGRVHPVKLAKPLFNGVKKEIAAIQRVKLPPELQKLIWRFPAEVRPPLDLQLSYLTEFVGLLK